MKLFYSATSPYVRMVHAVAIVKGLDAAVEKVAAREPGVNLDRLNPLNKVPTLTTDDGETLIESALICQHLDDVGQGPKLYGDDPTARRRILQLEALGHGVLDAAVLCRMEARERPPEMHSAKWLERQQQKIRLGLGAIEAALDKIGPTLGVPHITYACTLFFLDQHKLHEDWRDRFPKLAAWYDSVRRQPPLAATEPKLG